MKSIIPFALLQGKDIYTFSFFNLATIDTWFFDFDLEILLMESYERSI